MLGDAGLVIIPVPEYWKTTIGAMTEDEVPIPKGFIYVEGTKTTGAVIKNELSNEFVWIPTTEISYVKDLTFRANCTPTGDTTPSDKIGVPVSKKGAVVWTNIGYTNAKASAEYTKIKNIYDLAGNVWEWTNETTDSTHIYRGGGYSDMDGGYEVSHRNIYGGASYIASYIGFRVRLYIK